MFLSAAFMVALGRPRASVICAMVFPLNVAGASGSMPAPDRCGPADRRPANATRRAQ